MKVYLAGAITGLTFDESVDWREYAKKRLSNNDYENYSPLYNTGIVGYSPMRAKDYLAGLGALSGHPEAYDDYILSTAKGITYRDSWDVQTADLILVNLLGTEKVSIGTVLEIGMGYAQRKPIVVAMEEDNIHNHAMLNTMVGWICPDLDYAIEITKAILLPDGVRVPA